MDMQNRPFFEKGLFRVYAINRYNKGTPFEVLDQNGKTEPGLDSEPDLSARTSVAKCSLSFNTSIMK